MFPEKTSLLKNEHRASITFWSKNFVMEALFVYRSKGLYILKMKPEIIGEASEIGTRFSCY